MSPQRGGTCGGSRCGHSTLDRKWTGPALRKHNRLLPKGGMGGMDCSSALSFAVDAAHFSLTPSSYNKVFRTTLVIT